MALNFPNNPADGDIYQALGRGWKYNSTAGIWEALIRVNTAFDSDDITEGSVNLYQSPENIDDRVSQLLQAGNNITLNYDDLANTLTISGFSSNIFSITDGVTTEQIDATNTVTFLGTANEVEVAVSATDTVTVGLPSDVTIGNDLTVTGNLVVNGTTTTINSTELSVDDLNITIASGAADAATADGAGITIDGASATLIYDNALDAWQFNKQPYFGTDRLLDTADTLDSFSDVDFSTPPADGQTIIWNAAQSRFEAGESFSQAEFETSFDTRIATTNITALADVEAGPALDGEILFYSTANSQFEFGYIGTANLQTGFYVNDTYTGDGNTVDYALSHDPGTAQALLVLVDNIVQEPAINYTTSSTTLTFTGAPALNARIYIRYLGLPANVTTVGDGTITNAKLSLTYSSNQYTGDGNTVNFTIASGHTDDSVLVILDGLILPPSDYTVAGTTLTFAVAPLQDQSIDIRYMPV